LTSSMSMPATTCPCRCTSCRVAITTGVTSTAAALRPGSSSS
jgi:hypothetical protein